VVEVVEVQELVKFLQVLLLDQIQLVRMMVNLAQTMVVVEEEVQEEEEEEEELLDRFV
jgi:hypothetical protein